MVLALALVLAACETSRMSGASGRPEGPCDIYADAGTPCVAAHSSTRALLASYDGPLYQVMRQSDGATLDIGVVQPTAMDAGGYADAAAQDEFCADTYCWITTLYDQSGQENHLYQAPRGGFSGPALGGFNNVPVADMAPVTLSGHKVYGVFIVPGMGLRQNDPRGTAVDDQAQGQYWVVNGHHYNSGCCFNYGNAETDSRDDGDGTMETLHFGNSTGWYHGREPGPWVMTDQENNLVGCVNEDPNDKYCADLPTITWRFVTATADGEPHHWRSMGGNAQSGELQVMYDGGRIQNDRSSYDPMRKQGAILFGNGGDNSRQSQGTFYEGAMTAANTFPTQATNQAIQANVVAARYDVPRLTLAPAEETSAPPGLQTFSPSLTQRITLEYTNTSQTPATDLRLSLTAPRGWTSVVEGSGESSRTFADPVAPGAGVSATFEVTSGTAPFNGDLVGNASWTDSGTEQSRSELAAMKVRNVSPVKINEFRITAASPDNATDSFIELYNAGETAVDLSGWTLTHHPTREAVFSSVAIPAGTSLPAGGFYVLGLSTSGLAVPAAAGESTLFLRGVDGLSVGSEVQIGTGPGAETRTITRVGTGAGLVAEQSPSARRRFVPPGSSTTLWQPIPDGPVITVPVGSTSVPVTSTAGFQVGQRMAIGYGTTYPAVSRDVEQYEVVTVTEVGKPGTQGWLSMDAAPGDTNIKVSATGNISVGDRIRLDIESEGHCIETVTVTRVGTPSERNTFRGPLTEDEDPGTGLDLAEPLRCDHASNMPFSAWGTGITFEPATRYPHSSHEPVLPLGTGITLDRPLSNEHPIHDVLYVPGATAAGFQGAPDQWFGGPAVSAEAGNMVLRDAAGLVVDGLNYGEVVDPWAAEGWQAESGRGENGCYVNAPIVGRGRFFGGGGGMPAAPDLSVGRFPDGQDTDSNCADFQVQSTTSMAAASAAGVRNLKVAGVQGFTAGQSVIIDAGATKESAVIAEVGTPGATTVGTATTAGETLILVPDINGFTEGQTISIGSGADQETAVIVATERRRGASGTTPTSAITVAAPLTKAHAVGSQVSGSGITLSSPLTRAHASGTPIVSSVPTPGAPNRYR